MNAAVTIVPGLTVLTRIPSGASDFARFFVMLVRAAFDAVYATIMGLWRWMECAEILTMRAHSPLRNNGRAARTVRTAVRVPVSNTPTQPSSSRSSKRAAPGPMVLTRTLSSPQRSSS